MPSVYQILHQEFSRALTSLLSDQEVYVDPMLRVTTDKKFGDYQSNAAMGLAKKLKKNPRELAQDIISELNLEKICERLEVAGPGFINVFLKTDFIENSLLELLTSEKLGVSPSKPLQHVIDFSSPNLAKEMHVGHLRTTITGEAIARILEFVGHPVERVNHVGDWGTQFGMLLQYIYDHQPEVVDNPEGFEVSDLQEFYKQAKACFDGDEDFADKSRHMVVLLQSGDKTAHKIWQAFVKESLRHCHEIYHVLGVRLDDVGESFYNDRLADTVQELKAKGLAVEDEGAVCIFLEGYQNRDGDPLPMIIQKKDGGYNYDTTDLAAIKYRIFERHAKRLIYVTDLRQSQHFQMLFAATQKAGWADASIDMRHIGYGMVLGADKKPFKTRDGGTVRLKNLIDESVERSLEMISKNPNNTIPQDKVADTAQKIGLAAIKYADLSHNLASDYVFHWDKMLAMEGNTGPYMLYAYARIQSVLRKSGVDPQDLLNKPVFSLSHHTEIDLAKILCRFADVVNQVASDLKPNLLTDYLYAVSKAFSSFYDKKQGVSILSGVSGIEKSSRLLLSLLTAKVLQTGLDLLGIDVVEEM